MLFVVDTDAARTALRAGALACPQDGCSGRLHPWGTARPRTVLARVGDRVTLRPDRARCGACRSGQTLLPAWYVPARSCGIEVIGPALAGYLVDGHGQGRIAADLGVAASTVRGWLRGAKDAAAAVYGLVRDVGRDITRYGPAAGRALSPLNDPTPAVVAGLAELVRVALAWLRPDPPDRCQSPTGVSYLHLLVRGDRRDTNRRLRLVDPADARPGLGLWPAINILAGGRLPGLLTAPAPG